MMCTFRVNRFAGKTGEKSQQILNDLRHFNVEKASKGMTETKLLIIKTKMYTSKALVNNALLNLKRHYICWNYHCIRKYIYTLATDFP